MKNNLKILAIIPARSGSKGLRNKNVTKLKNKPLLYYPIRAAKNSKYINKVILSTDSNIYAKLGLKYGAEAPFLRPKKYSLDMASSSSLIVHCINHLKSKRDYYDYLVLLEPTSPLTTSKDIDDAIKKIILNKCTSLVSVAASEKFSSQNFFKIRKNILNVKNIKEINFHKPRQKLKEYFMDGSIYISKAKDFIKNKSFITNKTFGYVIKDKVKNLEIDCIEDLNYLNFKLKNKKL